MKTSRPVNLNLISMRFPITAITSILHRITGVVLFLFIPYLLWLLSLSLASSTDFAMAVELLKMPLHTFIMWAGLSSLAYHLLAGVRHLLMDLGWGESLHVAKSSSVIMLGLSLIVAIGIGVWLW